MREEVKWFANLMEKRLDGEKAPWQELKTDGYLLSRLVEEASDLIYYLVDEKHIRRKEIIRECADIANFAMMIAHRTEKGINQ